MSLGTAVLSTMLACATPQKINQIPQSRPYPEAKAANSSSESIQYDVYPDKPSREKLLDIFPEYQRSLYLNFLLKDIDNNGIFEDPKDGNRPYAKVCAENPNSEKAKTESRQKAQKILIEHACEGVAEGGTILSEEFRQKKYGENSCTALTGEVICNPNIEIQKSIAEINKTIEEMYELNREIEQYLDEEEKGK